MLVSPCFDEIFNNICSTDRTSLFTFTQTDDEETKVVYASQEDGAYVRMSLPLSLSLIICIPYIAISSDWEMCWTNELC